MKKRDTFVIIIFVIIAAVVVISYFKNSNKIDEETLKCIASRTELYVSRTCSRCAEQEMILNGYMSYFKISDCIANPEECTRKNIERVPAWIVNGEKQYGVKSLKELKRIAGC